MSPLQVFEQLLPSVHYHTNNNDNNNNNDDNNNAVIRYSSLPHSLNSMQLQTAGSLFPYFKGQLHKILPLQCCVSAGQGYDLCFFYQEVINSVSAAPQ